MVIYVVIYGIQNRTFVPSLAAMHRILIPVSSAKPSHALFPFMAATPSTERQESVDAEEMCGPLGSDDSHH
jgi:hypothetical protein